MIGTLALGGVIGIATGVARTVGQMDAVNPVRRKLHVDTFRSVHAENLRLQSLIESPVVREVGSVSDVELPPSPRRNAVSFDLFDTLVGRTVPHPSVIFDIVEKRSGVVGFASARKQAEFDTRRDDGLGGIVEIYEKLAQLPSIAKRRPPINSIDALRQLEWEVELEHSVLIRSNVDKLNSLSSDVSIIILSDMYYNAIQLRELLTHVKMPRLEEIAIYASRSGKSEGWVWPILGEAYTIDSHTGDNWKTDVESAEKSRLVCRVIHSATAHTPTRGETFFFNKNSLGSSEFIIGSWIRRLSLGNPYTAEENVANYHRYRDSMSFAMPVFWYYLRTIGVMLNSNPEINHLVAVSRDCIILEPLIEKYLLGGRGIFIEESGGERPVTMTRLLSSRRVLREVLKNPNPEYIAYVKRCIGEDHLTKSLVLDINGTYKSVGMFCDKFFGGAPRAHYISRQPCLLTPYETDRLSVAIPHVNTNVIEYLNASRNGSMIGYAGSLSEPFGGPVYTMCEYAESHIDVIQQAIVVDAPLVVRFDEPNELPRLQTMMDFLPLVKRSVTIEPHRDYQVQLSSLVYRTYDVNTQREFELAQYFERIISRFHSRHSDNPVNLLDVPWFPQMKNAKLAKLPKKTSILPWAECLGDRGFADVVDQSNIVLLNCLKKKLYDLVVFTVHRIDDARKLLDILWSTVKTFLAVNVVDTSNVQDMAFETLLVREKTAEAKFIVSWHLIAGDGLPRGSLLIFERRKQIESGIVTVSDQ